MEPAATFFVHGRCACGQRYRIRNAQPGVVVSCPACGRTIPLSMADIRAAMAGASLVPLQEESADTQEAILIDAGELQLAREGSRPGLTGSTAPDHHEAAVIKGLNWRTAGLSGTPSEGESAATAQSSRPRGFVGDLLASFYFAGRMSNALNVLATAAGCAVFWLAIILLPRVIPLFGFILALIALVFVLLYIVQFYWSLLGRTAAGDDDLPWFDADWDLWDDAFKPLLWLLVISVLCSLPALSLDWYLPASFAWRAHTIWAGLIVGWFFWPVAVMSVALGNTLLFLRPDWLVRCALGIGPVYLLAWLLVMVVLVGWVAFQHLYGRFVGLPIIGGAVSLYFGYVLFRMLGLLFRHFRARFPWKF